MPSAWSRRNVSSTNERAPDGEHLLLTTRQGAARLREPFLQAREVGEDAVEHGGVDRALHAADLEVLAHGEVREDPAALGDVADAVTGHFEGGPGGDGRPLEADGPGADTHETEDGVERGRLADAVAPHDHRQLIRGHLERHAVQHVALAVVRVHTVEDEHQRPPK